VKSVLSYDKSSSLLSLLVCLVCLEITGCTSYVTLSGDRKFPKHPEQFEVQPGGPYAGNEGIDFNAIYYQEVPFYDVVPRYVTLRFWSNGRVLCSGARGHLPTRADAERLEPVDVGVRLGYYQVTGTNVLIEWFGYQADAIYFPAIGFTRWWAVIDGEDIVLVQSKTRELGSRKRKEDGRYKRQHLDGLESQPDW